jgi:hypothetical protein
MSPANYIYLSCPSSIPQPHLSLKVFALQIFLALKIKTAA